jgi:protein TonB
MFDLITGKATHTPYTPFVPMVVSTVTQVAIVGVLVVVPWLYMTDQLPTPSTMMAFVAAPPLAPSPPPPPPPPDRPRAPEVKPAPASSASAAPVEAPPEIVAEAPEIDYGEEGMPGVEGGVPAGIVGGIVGGVDVPPPPPPPPPAPQGPIRIGGEIKEPALVHRVEPIYPPYAVSANIEGVVILEATVDREGRIEELRVLRSHPVLEKAAMEAVRQWRYSPVLLNGKPERFILTVVVTFKLQEQRTRGR